MRGILGGAAVIPHHRLTAATVAAAHGSGSGKGSRSVATYDQDAVTLAAEAGLDTLATAGAAPEALWFSTTAPPYADRTNATAIHAALRLPSETIALDMVGSVRSATGAVLAALRSTCTVLVAAGDLRTGLPGSADEREGGDAGGALLIGDDTPTAPVLAEWLGGASATEEFLDRWRTPGEQRSRLWDERFGELHYTELADQAWSDGLTDAGLAAADVTALVVTGTHSRAVGRVRSTLVKAGATPATDLRTAIGAPGAAEPLIGLVCALEGARPGDVIALVSLSDGADVAFFRATPAVTDWHPRRPVAEQVAVTDDSLPYLRFLSWRGMVDLEPPRRPEPARTSASAGARNSAWKFGLVGSRDRESGTVHLPPARVAYEGGAVDDMDPFPLADATGTVATFTIDHLAYSPSPPIVFAVVDFDGGGRLPVELTDADAASITVGTAVEMTFRRLGTSDGIHNYFWKARPIRRPVGQDGAGAESEV